MKYRLTVKGQVALATIVLLIFVGAGSLIQSNKSKVSETQPTLSSTGQDNTAKPETPVSALPEAPGSTGVNTAPTEDVPSQDELANTKAIVYFNPDQWEIQAGEIQKITEITAVLLKYPSLKIVVEGNINGFPGATDSDFGVDLSTKRAQVVAQVLIGKGIDEARIILKSNGSSEPVTEEQDKVWMNRRATVYIQGFKGDTP